MSEGRAPLGTIIGEGRDSVVYDIGGGRVLRRYRKWYDTAAEARMMMWVRDHGMPVPEVFDSDGADLVMEKISGPSLLAGLATHPARIPAVGRLLADMHHRLAEVPTAPWMPTRYVDDPTSVRLGVIHCDLHPDNIVVSPCGPVLIDWTRACAGDRRADLAHTWIILADLGLPANPLQRRFELAARRVVLRSFTTRIDRDGARKMLASIALDRLADKNTHQAERARLRRYLPTTA